MNSCCQFCSFLIHIFSQQLRNIYLTSNVTGRHRSPKRKLPAGVACAAFLQILSIFSSTEGYGLQLSIPHAYFVYTVWHCTGQHCSSKYTCTYRLFVGMWRPLVSVITTLYYTMLHICCFTEFTQRIVNKIKVQASSSHRRLPFVSWPPLLS